ncbi:MAG: lysophospholipase [Clostridia bacterium]|nr:lysophospholipase [Clostridia bacterium]MBQ3867982.1 lysophospholipase [Clostridia bacterium]MBQ9880811.1 lysophospholipase [Clostridia bacterium]
MKTWLFQGDSVTDYGRGRGDDPNMGAGYPLLIAAKLSYERPGEFKFVNRAISGNRTVDVLARSREDITQIEPDILTVLIGVNDCWRMFDGNSWLTADQTRDMMDLMLRYVKGDRPECRVIVMEPFILHGPATDGSYDAFRSEVEKHSAALKSAAEANGCEFMPLQYRFDEAAKNAPAELYLRDGVHPAPAGHELIARALMEFVGV